LAREESIGKVSAAIHRPTIEASREHPLVHCDVLTAKRVRRWQEYQELYGPEHEILSGETGKVSIHCFIRRGLRKPGKMLELPFTVTDDFGREHPLPPIELLAIDMTPEK
jgi:hypothetical protein